MSASLVLDSDPIDQPAASDPAERQSWCALQIRVGHQCASRLWDKSLQQERRTLYVPAIPIAAWIARNWWCLLEEPMRTDDVLKHPAAEAQRAWARRHCLRAADSSLLLPALYLFSDGARTRIKWLADDEGSLPNMPGEFSSSGDFTLDSRVTADALARFVTETLARLSSVRDECVEAIRTLWQAIQAAGPEEIDFCRVAARMGLDPYNGSHLSDEIVRIIEDSLADPDDPLSRDLTEATTPARLVEDWQWVDSARRTYQLEARRSANALSSPRSLHSHPWQQGYRLAQIVRPLTGGFEEQPISNVEQAASTLLNVRFEFIPQSHLTGSNLRGIVGGAGADRVRVAAPPQTSGRHRFLLARSLYQILVGCSSGPRLITDAYTYDQQASRAFAAEFLAPQAALLSRTSGDVDSNCIDELASEFEVSPTLIRRQLTNAGAIIIED